MLIALWYIRSKIYTVLHTEMYLITHKNKVFLRLTVSRLVYPGIRPPFGTRELFPSSSIEVKLNIYGSIIWRAVSDDRTDL
jgi:hypothetical protein